MDSNNSRKEVYSTSVKAGSRTYFFDVRENRKGDFFFTICESRKVYDDFGNIKYEKSKIYLYQDAFEDFVKGYENVIEYIKNHKPEYFEPKVIEDNQFNDCNVDETMTGAPIVDVDDDEEEGTIF